MSTREPKATIVAYQCPSHKEFVTLVVECGSSGTRFATGKCCPSQYKREIHRWRLNAADVEEFCEELRASLEHAEREKGRDREIR